MIKLLKQRYFTAAVPLLLATSVNAAPVQSISVSGQIVADNSFGTLVHHVGRNFNYEATYELDTSKAFNTWINWGDWTVYEIDDGGVTYQNSACIYDGADIASGVCDSSNIVSFEFNDNLVENWSSDAGFLNLGLADGTALDAIVLGFENLAGFEDPSTGVGTDIWVTLLFEADLFDGYDPNGLPQSISLDKYVGGGGEFEQDDNSGYAQFRVDAVSVSAVPVPAAVWLFGSGLLGLVGVARRKKP